MLNQLEFTEQLYQKMLGHDGFSNHMLVKAFNLSGCQIDVVDQKGKMFTCYTDTIYNRYLKNPPSIDTIFTETLATYHDLFLLDECVAENVLPIIKNQEWLTKAKYMHMACNHGADFNFEKMQQEESLTIPLIEDLIIAFAVNSSKGLHFLSQQELLRYSPDNTLRGIYLKAKENLADYLHTLKVNPAPVGYVLEVDFNPASSMVLIYDQWQDKLKIHGFPVFALLAHDTVMLADSSDHEQLGALRKFVQEVYPTVTNHLSSNIFTIRNGKFELLKNSIEEI